MHIASVSDSLTLLDLIRMAAKLKDLDYQEGSSRAHSTPISTYHVDANVLRILAEHNITEQDRPATDRVLTLVDQSYTKALPGHVPGNYWNFNLDKEPASHRIGLSVGFGIDTMRRGIILVPQAHATIVSPVDFLPNFHMFRALIKTFETDTPVAMDIANSEEGIVTVTWTDMGLSGIRKLSELFREFIADKTALAQLATQCEVFDPHPYRRPHEQPGHELFIPERAQPALFAKWGAQLDAYRASLG